MTYFNLNKRFPLFGSEIETLFFRSLEDSQLFNRTDCSYPYNVLSHKDGSILLEYCLAGFSKEDVNIKVEHDHICIEVKCETEEDKDVKYIYRGIAERSMKHTLKLDPKSVDTKKITAEFKNGILTVTLPPAKEKKNSSYQVEIK